MFSFSCQYWSAWAPSLENETAWRAWIKKPYPIRETHPAAVTEMPALLRRRAHRLGRAALKVLYSPQLNYIDQPIIFCSRHGEVERSLSLQQSLTREDHVSPQEFSMSVHNAIPGLFSIARGIPAKITAIASENALALSGLQEALAQLAEEPEKPRALIFCDAPLPSLFAPFLENEPFCYAFALIITCGNNFMLERRTVPQTATQPSTASISALPLLQFILDEQKRCIPLSADGCWQAVRY